MSNHVDPTRPSSTASVSGTGSSGTRAASSGTQVDIAALVQRFGWTDGGWQQRLLQSADAQGSHDGKVNVAELEGYLKNPNDAQFVSSGNVVAERQELASHGGAEAVDQFKKGWQQTIAQNADKLGNADSKLDQEELEAYIAKMREEKGAFPSWFPDQKKAAFESKIASSTGEKDALSVGGETRPVSPQGAPITDANDGVQIIKDYMRLATDNNNRVPPWVSYVMSAQDMQVQADPARPKIGFHLDPDQPRTPSPRVTDGEYTLLNKAREGQVGRPNAFDRGHMREAESSVNAESMYESFQTDNISTQYGVLNQGAWRYLEDATRELVQSSGGKATVVTGNLFLGKDGKPLPQDQIDRQKTTLGSNGLAIPTHCFKTVLIEKPNGEKQMFAYVVPNDPTLSTDLDTVQGRLQAEKWRVNVDKVESLIGRDLYANLPKSTQARLERDSTSQAVLDKVQYKMANLFMGDGTYDMAGGPALKPPKKPLPMQSV